MVEPNGRGPCVLPSPIKPTGKRTLSLPFRLRIRASRRIGGFAFASTLQPRVVAETLSQLLNPEKVKLEDLGSAIETWEEKVRAYEARRGPDGERKEMDDDIKTGALQSMCPESLQTHLSMNSKRLTCYAEVRAEITSYIEARVGIRMKTPASNARDPNAMDVGQLQQQLAQKSNSSIFKARR